MGNLIIVVANFIKGIWNEILKQLPRWLLFNVCIALSPLVLNYLKAILFAETNGEGFINSLSRNGELFIISTAILGESVGDLVASKNTGIIATVVGGVCVLLLISTTFLFAAVTAYVPSQDRLETFAISQMSLRFFCASFVVSACCKLMSPSPSS